MSITRIIAASAVVLVAPLHAQSSVPPLHVKPSLEECEVWFAPTLTQANFRRFVREFGSVSAYKQSASPSGLTRGEVSVGIEMTSFTLEEHAPAWNDTFAHPTDHHPLGSRQNFPKLKLRVGVSENADVGAFYAKNPKANYGWLGVDGKYRIVSERENQPMSVAVRAAYTKTIYVTDMDMHALTGDVSVERHVWGMRPYLGLGFDGVYARETSAAVNLRNETTIAPHVFAGVSATVLRRLNLGAELTAGALPSAQVQVSAIVF